MKKKKTTKKTTKKAVKRAAPKGRAKKGARKPGAKRKSPKKGARRTAKKPLRRKRARPELPKHRFDAKVYARKRACVLGMGRSGFEAARLLARKGFKVLVSDARPRRELRDLAAKLPGKVKWEGGGHSDRVLKAHFAVKSPGIPSHAPVLGRLRDAGIPIFSELEVALAFAPEVDVVAVTGTNGKTTTAAMTASVFKAARKKVHLLGNVGMALSGSVNKLRKGHVLVLEVSSYQLEDSRHFKPDAAVILNITSDHIDHHGSMDAYVEAKARVFRQFDRSRTCVFNAADPLTLGLSRRCRGRKLFFGHETSTRTAAWLEKGKIHLHLPGEKKVSKVAPPKLPGSHNIENAMGAALVAAARGVTPAAIAKGFKSFRGVEHRIEECGSLGGMLCINDSKATNTDSTIAALRSVGPDHSGKILLILGGLHKGGGFGSLRPLIERHVKGVLSIGSASRKIEEDLQGAADVFPCENLETAVQVAGQIGREGEVLLLSPACASFDQFKSFEDRGTRFKELIAKGRGK